VGFPKSWNQNNRDSLCISVGGKLNCSKQSSLLFLTHPCRHQDEEASVIALSVHCVQSLLLKVLRILDQIDCYFRVWISSSSPSSSSSSSCCLDKVVENDKDSHGDNGRTNVCEACRLTTTCPFRLLLLFQQSTPGLRKRTHNFFKLEEHIVLNPNPKNKENPPNPNFEYPKKLPKP